VKSSTKKHWQDFWDVADRISLEDVYGNDGRIVREISALGPLGGKKILEVGAGSGRDAVALASAGAEVWTLDYVSGSLDLTKTAADKNGVQVQPIAGDALSKPFATNSFDIVFHQGLLEHFRDPMPLLVEDLRVLKPGGHLIVDVPQTFHYYTIGKKILIALGKWFAGWETQFTPDQLEKVGINAGGELVRTYGDWMVPGLWYRAIRKVLVSRFGIRLPMYPPGLPLGWLRNLMKEKRIALYSMMTIGVVLKKPEQPK
jgi:SAM-dependent methyltransferase